VTVTLRPARAGDAPLLRAWRNDPETRRWSLTSGEVGEAEHAAWLAARLADPATLLLVAEAGGEPVGQVRVDRRGDGVGTVSIAVTPEARGRGHARRMLAALHARDDLGVATLCALVLEGNERSLGLFAAAGYREVGRADGTVTLERAV
jgi:RimJ/RimL family protein N-acetyltransferase